jgi:hypothetical protein
MPQKTTWAWAWLAALAAPALAATGDATPTAASGHHRTLPAAQCLRTDSAVDWQKLDDRHLLVRNLGRSYLLRLSSVCLGIEDTARIDLVGAGMNRLCGRLGEYVIARGDRCRVETVELIDEATYRALSSGERKPDPPR